MEIKLGDIIETLIDKETYWGHVDFFMPKGSLGVVCDVDDDGCITIETMENTGLPFALVEYKVGEYKKVDNSGK